MIAMIPYIFATLVLIVWSRNSDHRNERRLHSALPLGMAALAMLGVSLVKDPYVATTMISFSLASLYAFKSPFWALPTLFLSRETASVSIAVINSIGNLGGFVGPFAIGYIKGASSSTATGLLFLSAFLVVAFFMAVFICINQRKDPPAEAPAYAH